MAPLGPEPARADPHRRGGQALEDWRRTARRRLFDQSGDEIGGPEGTRRRPRSSTRARGRSPSATSGVGQRRAGGGLTVNGGRLRFCEILRVSGASSGVLYLPSPDGGFLPAASLGGGEAASAVGREEARRAADERRTLFISVEPATPTINVYDGRILPRESLTIPLVYFDHVVGVLALGAAQAFTAPPETPLGDRAVARGGRGRVDQRAGRRAVWRLAGQTSSGSRGPHHAHGPRAPAGSG